MNQTSITVNDFNKIKAALYSTYNNELEMFNVESDVCAAIGSESLGEHGGVARGGNKFGNVVDFILHRGAGVPIECKTTTTSNFVETPLEYFLDKADSSGFQISEFAKAKCGSEVLNRIIDGYRMVAKNTDCDVRESTILVVVKHEIETYRYVQVYVANFWKILQHCNNLCWSGNKLNDPDTGKTLMKFSISQKGRTTLHLKRDGFIHFNPTLLGQFRMNRQLLKQWTPKSS
jgi:hypothetical protein